MIKHLLKFGVNYGAGFETEVSLLITNMSDPDWMLDEIQRFFDWESEMPVADPAVAATAFLIWWADQMLSTNFPNPHEGEVLIIGTKMAAPSYTYEINVVPERPVVTLN